jgi:hypothetical protein
VLGKTVENTTHFHDCAGALDFIAKNFSAVRRRKNGLADIESDFPAIDIKGGNHFDILRLVRADATVHEAGTVAVAIGPAIKIDSLDERTGTVAHSDDGDSDFAHFEIVKAEKLSELDLLGARHKLGNFNLNSCACLAAAPSVANAECVRSRARLQELI